MMAGKKLLLVFALVFTLAMAGGGISAANGNARSESRGSNQSQQNPGNRLSPCKRYGANIHPNNWGERRFPDR